LRLSTAKPRAASAGDATVADDMIGGYRLLKHLVTGQTSQVWEAVEVSSHRHFAIKMLLPEKARDAAHRRLLFHEAEVGKALAHPNIIKIVAFSKSANNPYMVMEFFPAGNLKMRLMRKEHDFLREKLHDILKQAATALAFMNAKGWVHRDVKPDNFLVNSAGEVRLIDFALATRAQKASMLGKLFRRKGKAQGTRSYMSPEQIRGEPLDCRADVYSFGATCYELVTGRQPFRGASSQELLQKHILEKPVSPKSFNPEVTDEFADLVLRMLAKKPKERPQHFHEVLMTLRQIRVFKPVSSKQKT
jgi:eukaryotic-like serine/threonine-protein kinase